jgi:YidC/Oxa1 family membrane protein insertase
MGQQFYVIRNNPAPGTAAEKAKAERDRLKAEKHGKPAVIETTTPVVEEVQRTPPRQQPKKQSKKQRKQTPGQRPAPKPKPEGGTDA